MCKVSLLFIVANKIAKSVTTPDQPTKLTLIIIHSCCFFVLLLFLWEAKLKLSFIFPASLWTDIKADVKV